MEIDIQRGAQAKPISVCIFIQSQPGPSFWQCGAPPADGADDEVRPMVFVIWRTTESIWLSLTNDH